MRLREIRVIRVQNHGYSQRTQILQPDIFLESNCLPTRHQPAERICLLHAGARQETQSH